MIKMAGLVNQIPSDSLFTLSVVSLDISSYWHYIPHSKHHTSEFDKIMLDKISSPSSSCDIAQPTIPKFPTKLGLFPKFVFPRY
jgi:hypothetical protein